MVEKFEDGKKYVFSADLFYKWHSTVGRSSKPSGGWEKKIDGKEVEGTGSYDGRAGGFGVTPPWCREVISDLHTILEHCEKIHREAVNDYCDNGDRMDLGRAMGIGEIKSYCKGILSVREGE